MKQTMKAPSQCRVLFILLALVIFSLLTNSAAEAVSIGSITRNGDGRVQLAVASAPAGAVTIDVSTDLESWTELTNATPDSAGLISLIDAPAATRFYRVFSGGSSYFTAVFRSPSGALLTNAALTIEATGQSYLANSAGEVKIPTRLVRFESGYRVRVSAPGLVDLSVNLSPYTYFYSFMLSPPPPVGLAPLALTAIEVRAGAGSTFNGLRYVINFTGARSGTFIVPSQEWRGTFTYTPNGDTAHLRMDYLDWPGDFDDMSLTFTPGPSGTHTFSGTQSVLGTTYAFNGTFRLDF